MNSRIGQWKLTDDGAVTCIAEGDGYVMYRNRGRLPKCMEAVLWDEHLDTVYESPFGLIPHPFSATLTPTK